VGVLLILDNKIDAPKKHIQEVEVYTMRAAELTVKNLMDYYGRGEIDILHNIWISNAPKAPIGYSEQFQV